MKPQTLTTTVRIDGLHLARWRTVLARILVATAVHIIGADNITLLIDGTEIGQGGSTLGERTAAKLDEWTSSASGESEAGAHSTQL